VIGPTGAVRVMVATKPVDFRKGAEGLAALVRESMGADPFSGAVYVFRSRRADRVKLVFWDGTGVVLVAKRLEDGKFQWPSITDGVVRLTAAQLQALFEGLAQGFHPAVYPPEAWWAVAQALAAGGHHDRAARACQRARQWIERAALPETDARERHCFLQHNPVNRAVLQGLVAVRPEGARI
jgi:transposase